MTERFETRALAACFGLHRQLADAAVSLSRRLQSVHEDADLLRLGASCIHIAAQEALQASDPRQMLRSWRECALAEQQIRIATYRALRDGCIETRVYDDLFRLATKVARIREDERQRVRRQLHRLDLV
jgi:hypothetical protein